MFMVGSLSIPGSYVEGSGMLVQGSKWCPLACCLETDMYSGPPKRAVHYKLLSFVFLTAILFRALSATFWGECRASCFAQASQEVKPLRVRKLRLTSRHSPGKATMIRSVACVDKIKQKLTDWSFSDGVHVFEL